MKTLPEHLLPWLRTLRKLEWFQWVGVLTHKLSQNMHSSFAHGIVGMGNKSSICITISVTN